MNLRKELPSQNLKTKMGLEPCKILREYLMEMKPLEISKKQAAFFEG